jgi:hypothetical protein
MGLSRGKYYNPLTEFMKAVMPFFRYFKGNNLTLKQPLLYTLFLLITVNSFAQHYNNIEFIENKGQWDARVHFLGQISNGSFFIRNGGFTVVQHHAGDMSMLGRYLHGVNAEGNAVTPNDRFILRSHAWNVDFVGASPLAEVIPDKILPSYNNYFIGNDRAKWAPGCKLFQAVTLKDVYPNIDVRYYTDKEYLKYDIIVKPGGDVSKIALKYEGIESIQVKNKELAVGTSVGEMRESSPYTYLAGVNGKQQVSCKYIVKDNIVRFEVKEYDPTKTLIIDPIIVFGSFSVAVQTIGASPQLTDPMDLCLAEELYWEAVEVSRLLQALFKQLSRVE